MSTQGSDHWWRTKSQGSGRMVGYVEVGAKRATESGSLHSCRPASSTTPQSHPDAEERQKMGLRADQLFHPRPSARALMNLKTDLSSGEDFLPSCGALGDDDAARR